MEGHQDGVVVVAFAAFSDDLLTDGNSLGVLEAGVDLGVGVGGFLDAPCGRRRGVEYVDVDVVKGPVEPSGVPGFFYCPGFLMPHADSEIGITVCAIIVKLQTTSFPRTPAYDIAYVAWLAIGGDA